MSIFTLKAMTRNIATVVFGFLFPLVFIAIFGLLGSQSQSLTLGLPDGSNQDNPITQAVKNLNFVKISLKLSKIRPTFWKINSSRAELTAFSLLSRSPGNRPAIRST